MEDRGDISVKSLTVPDTVEQRGGSDIDLDNLVEDGSRKNNTIFIVIIALVMVRLLREGIGFTHRSSGYMSDGEVEAREV